mmetsp:Transcript_54392/g.126948  ORF Transcript_54392/g.126948 Transcript_54392/m.126948 type:complete len:472 (-) Transcript_54392:79-1494(-)
MRTPLTAPLVPQDTESEFDFQVEECLNGLAKRSPMWAVATSTSSARPRPTLFSEKRELETEVVALQRASENQQNELSAHLRQLRDQCNDEGLRIGELERVCEETWNDAQRQMQVSAEERRELEEELQQVELEREALMELKHQEEAQASLKVNTSQKSLMKLSAALETLQDKVQSAERTRAENLYDAETERLVRRELESAAEHELEACREQLNNHDADAASDMSSSKVLSKKLRGKPMDKATLEQEAEGILSRIKSTRDAKRQVQMTLESETAIWFHEVQTLKEHLRFMDEEARMEENEVHLLNEEHQERNEQREELVSEIESLSHLIREVDIHAESAVAVNQELDRELSRVKTVLQGRQSQRDQVRQMQQWLEKNRQEAARAEADLEMLREELDARSRRGILSCLRTRPAQTSLPSRVGGGESAGRVADRARPMPMGQSPPSRGPASQASGKGGDRSAARAADFPPSLEPF